MTGVLAAAVIMKTCQFSVTAVSYTIHSVVLLVTSSSNTGVTFTQVATRLMDDPVVPNVTATHLRPK